jgi:type 1 fimbria pilin
MNKKTTVGLAIMSGVLCFSGVVFSATENAGVINLQSEILPSTCVVDGININGNKSGSGLSADVNFMDVTVGEMNATNVGGVIESQSIQFFVGGCPTESGKALMKFDYTAGDKPNHVKMMGVGKGISVGITDMEANPVNPGDSLETTLNSGSGVIKGYINLIRNADEVVSGRSDATINLALSYE